MVAVVVAMCGKLGKEGDNHGCDGAGRAGQTKLATAQEEQPHGHVYGHMTAVGNDGGGVHTGSEVPDHKKGIFFSSHNKGFFTLFPAEIINFPCTPSLINQEKIFTCN